MYVNDIQLYTSTALNNLLETINKPNKLTDKIDIYLNNYLK